MTVIKMELGEPDASGRRRPVEIPGSEYEIELDTVIMSLGTSPNPLIASTTKGLETNRRKCIVAEEENGQTSKAAVFAGGDAVTGAATVILAMGAGKAGAKGIRESLVLVDQLAFIVNIPNQTVVTAMDQAETQANIFTNIDGAVIV